MSPALVQGWVSVLKDVATIVAAVFGALTFMVVYLKLRVEHPGYKLVLERELTLFSDVEKLAENLDPLLTNTTEYAELATEEIVSLRCRIKRLAASIYASEELRSALYSMSDLLREGAASTNATYAIRTDITLARWRECLNAMRMRVLTFASSDKPFRLFTFDVSTGRFSFVRGFATRRARKMYIKAHPMSEPTIQYQHWSENDERPGLISGYLR